MHNYWNPHESAQPPEFAQPLESAQICAIIGMSTVIGMSIATGVHTAILDPHRHWNPDHHRNPHESSTDAQKLGVICLIFSFDETRRQNMIQTQVSHISPVGHCQESQILDLLVCSCNQRPRSQRPRCSVVVDSQKIPKEASAL